MSSNITPGHEGWQASRDANSYVLAAFMQQQRDAQERVRQARLMQHQQAAHECMYVHARQQQEAYQARLLQYQQAAHDHARQQQEVAQAQLMQYQQVAHDHARQQQEVAQAQVMQYQQAAHDHARQQQEVAQARSTQPIVALVNPSSAAFVKHQAAQEQPRSTWPIAMHAHGNLRVFMQEQEVALEQASKLRKKQESQRETSEKDSPNHLHVAHVGECVVCLEESATHAIIPCGHQALCETCARHYKLHGNQNDCPVCRGPVDGVFKIFVAAPVAAASSGGSRGGIMSQPQVGIGDNSRADTTVPHQDSDVMSLSQDQLINHLIEMGFEANASKDALESSEGNAETAIAMLLSRQDSEQASGSVGNVADAIVVGEVTDLQSESPPSTLGLPSESLPRRSRGGRRSRRSMSQSQPRRHRRRSSSRHRQRSHQSRRSRSRTRR